MKSSESIPSDSRRFLCVHGTVLVVFSSVWLSGGRPPSLGAFSQDCEQIRSQKPTAAPTGTAVGFLGVCRPGMEKGNGFVLYSRYTGPGESAGTKTEPRQDLGPV